MRIRHRAALAATVGLIVAGAGVPASANAASAPSAIAGQRAVAAKAKSAPRWTSHKAKVARKHHRLLTLKRPVHETCSLHISRPHHRGKKWTYPAGKGRIQFDIHPSAKTRAGTWKFKATCVAAGSTTPHSATTSLRVTGKKPQKAFITGQRGPAFAVPLASGALGTPTHLPRVGGKGGSTGDDYPYKSRTQDSGFDPWGEYYRECTSFAAWALHSRNQFDMPFYADAGDWGTIARGRGYAVNSTPAVGAIAWQPRSSAHFWGHVAWVSSVSGGSVAIEEYNYDGHGHYNSRSVPTSTFQYIHFKDVIFSTPAPPDSTPPPPNTRAETTGGVAHTWTNYSNAGGTQGPLIGSNQTIQIACRRTGFQVADGNTWWYRIASSPWNNSYYVSADAFYNNGSTSGSLHGTPFVDTAVPLC